MAPPAVIEVEGLAYRYAGAPGPAVRELSFAIERGEIFGFLGPSGAGKTTTQKILIRLLRDYQGQVSVFGSDLGSWGPGYYERVGVSFESPNHYLKLSARENLEYFRRLYAGTTEAPLRLLEQVGLAADADKRVSQFSKGMRGRLNLARALLHRPELLFLDEPTAGLDPSTSRRIRSLIRERQQQGTTVFLTTHDMVVADELCSRVGFIVDGRIERIAAPRELKLRYGRRSVRVEYGADGGREQRDFPLEGLGQSAEFLELLRREDIQTIHTQETTLEEVFIQVTGKALI